MKYKHMPVKKYHSKYTDPNDNTSLNYLALAAAILDPNPKKDSRSYMLPELFNPEEGQKRIQEIDNIRATGGITEAEMIVLNEENANYDIKVRKELEAIKKRRVFKRRQIRVINKYAGEERIFSSMKEACEEYDLNYNSVQNTYKYYQKRYGANKIKYHGLIIEKM